MQIGEFLVKLGVISDVQKLEEFNESLKTVATVSATVVGARNGAAGVAFSFLDEQIKKTEEL